MLKLTVNASKIYDITIGSGLKGFNRIVNNIVSGNKIAIIIDSNEYSLYGDVLDEYLSEFTVHKCVVLSGEQNKNYDNY